MLRKFSLQIGLKFLSILLSLFIARWVIANLDTNSVKDYTVIGSYNNTILMAITLGLPALVQKYYTNVTDRTVLANFWATVSVLRFGSFFLGLGLLALCFPIMNVTSWQAAIALYCAQFILLADTSYRSITDARGRSWQFSLTDFIGKGLLLGLVLLLSNVLKLDLVGFSLVSIVAYFIAFVCDILWQKGDTGWGRFDTGILRLELGAIGFLVLTDFVTALYLRTDVPFLNYLRFSDTQIVSYSNAYKLFEIATVIPALMMPVIASQTRQKLNNQLISKKNLIVAFAQSFGFGVVLLILANLFSPLAVWLLDPSLKFPATQGYFQLLTPVLLILFPIVLANDLINLSGLEKYQFRSKLITAIFAIGCYTLLIPRFGPLGAVISTVAFFGLELFVKLWFVYKYVN